MQIPPDSGDGITRLLKEKDFGWGSQTVTPQQLRSTSVKHFQEATEEILDELPIPHSLRAEFLNKAVQLAPDVDAVRAVVRERYGSLVDMAKKPSLTSFILGENTTKSSTPINDYFNRSFQRRLNKSNLEDQIEKTTQDILKFERHAQRTPKKYFEAKPQRVVGMDEFAGAIVPYLCKRRPC